MPRFALVGHRPGETFVTPVGTFTSHAVDAGLDLNDEQLAYFHKSKAKLVALPDEEPAADAPLTDVAARVDRIETSNTALIHAQNALVVPGAAEVAAAGAPKDKPVPAAAGAK